MSMAIAETGLRRIALAYLELTKPRIVFLVLLTGVPALLLADLSRPKRPLLDLPGRSCMRVPARFLPTSALRDLSAR